MLAHTRLVDSPDSPAPPRPTPARVFHEAWLSVIQAKPDRTRDGWTVKRSHVTDAVPPNDVRGAETGDGGPGRAGAGAGAGRGSLGDGTGDSVTVTVSVPVRERMTTSGRHRRSAQ